MNLDYLSGLSAVLLAISLATERLVTVIKTLFPSLVQEHKNRANETDLIADRPRRIALQAIAFGCATLTTSLIVGDFPGSLLGSFTMGSGATQISLPVLLVGLLASGGSALWTNVVGFTAASKDVRVGEKAAQGLALRARAASLGLPVEDAGVVGRRSPTESSAPRENGSPAPPVILTGPAAPARGWPSGEN